MMDTFALRVDAAAREVTPHEAVIPSRAAAILRDWRARGVQDTPVMLFESGGRLIVADGHHRLEAARRAAAELGRAVTIAAAVRPIGEIRPAHKVIRSAPDGWIERCRARLRVGQRSLVLRADGSGEEAARLVWDAAELALEGVVWEIEGDADAAVDAVAGGAVAAILVPALTLAEVLAAAESGALLPPRSTNFHPKLDRLDVAFPLFAELLIPDSKPPPRRT